LREGLLWELHRVKGNHVVHPSLKETETLSRSSAKGWESVGYPEARGRARMPSSVTGVLPGSPGPGGIRPLLHLACPDLRMKSPARWILNGPGNPTTERCLVAMGLSPCSGPSAGEGFLKTTWLSSMCRGNGERSQPDLSSGRITRTKLSTGCDHVFQPSANSSYKGSSSQYFRL